MVYDYEYFFKNYIERTNKNLEIIDNYLSLNGQDVYEITQLINSLFGILVVPNEFFRPAIGGRDKETELHAVPGFNDIERIIDRLDETKRYRSEYSKENDHYKVRNFLNHLRNALAHSGQGGVIFYPWKEGKEIEGVYFSDVDDEGGCFCAKMDIATIRELKDALGKFYTNLDVDKSINSAKTKHKNSINDNESFLKEDVNELKYRKPERKTVHKQNNK